MLATSAALCFARSPRTGSIFFFSRDHRKYHHPLVAYGPPWFLGRKPKTSSCLAFPATKDVLTFSRHGRRKDVGHTFTQPASEAVLQNDFAWVVVQCGVPWTTRKSHWHFDRHKGFGDIYWHFVRQQPRVPPPLSHPCTVNTRTLRYLGCQDPTSPLHRRECRDASQYCIRSCR